VARARPITSRYSRTEAPPARRRPSRHEPGPDTQLLREAARHIPAGSRVLDVGCGNGELFRLLGRRLGEGVGIDPVLPGSVLATHYRLVRGWFPENLPATQPFDVITLLGVLEETPSARRGALVAACQRLLKPNGRLILTARAELTGLRDLEKSSGLDQAPSQLLVFSRERLAAPGGVRKALSLDPRPKNPPELTFE